MLLFYGPGAYFTTSHNIHGGLYTGMYANVMQILWFYTTISACLKSNGYLLELYQHIFGMCECKLFTVYWTMMWFMCPFVDQILFVKKHIFNCPVLNLSSIISSQCYFINRNHDKHILEEFSQHKAENWTGKLDS